MGMGTWSEWFMRFDRMLKDPNLGEQREAEGDVLLRELSELVLRTRRSENGRREINALYQFFWNFFSSFSDREEKERRRMVYFFAKTGFFYQMIQILYLGTTFEVYIDELLSFFSGIPIEMEMERFLIKVYMIPFLPEDVQRNLMESVQNRIGELPYPVIENGLFGGMIRYDEQVREIIMREMKRMDCETEDGGMRDMTTPDDGHMWNQCKRGNPVYLLVSLFLHDRISRQELKHFSAYFFKAPYLGYAADPGLYFFKIEDALWQDLFTKEEYVKQQKEAALLRLKESLAL